MLRFVPRFKKMPRQKQYNEEEVIEKAMDLFWRQGYESTSTRMLEKEMGINQFSIYSSFGSKQGVFIESIKCYRSKIGTILDKLAASENGLEGIKQFFYDFLEFAKDLEHPKGCLVTNTVNEMGRNGDPMVTEEIMKFQKEIKALFLRNLSQDKSKSKRTLEVQANYLLISKAGLSMAVKAFSGKMLEDYIETTFEKL